MTTSRIEWLSDLVRLEIELWNRVDAQLREEHNLPLAFFWPLYAVAGSPERSLRVGEIASELGLTVGGTSKIVDRIVAAGYSRREPDPTDRRASRIVLSDDGLRVLGAASGTYEAVVAAALDATLSPDEQQHMHSLVGRLLKASADDASR